jgi:protein SCO1/2
MKKQTRVNRRTVLRAAGATALSAALAGCTDALSSGGDGNDDVVLGPPKNYERRKDLDLPFPTYGEKLPSATVPAPLHDRTLETTAFVGERHTMLTFIYTSCVTVCPGLTNTLRHVQADSISEGYANEMAFMPTTFDPEHDTESVLRSYGKDYGVDLSAGNWYFLRPESPARARDVVTDTFGVAFQQGSNGDMSDGGMENGTDGEMGDNGDHSDMGHGRHFTHSSLILLVNKDGYVERAYNGETPSPDRAIDDTRTVLEEW